MYKSLKIGLLIASLLAFMLVSCGDDENATGPGRLNPLGYAKGMIYLNPGTVMPSLEIYGNGAVTPNLDSVKVGDSLIARDSMHMTTDWMFVDSYWRIPFVEDGSESTFMYEPGDTAIIRVWGDGRTGSCHVKLLVAAEATADIISPAYHADTIAPGESETVTWNRVEHVDYYAITVGWLSMSGGWIFYYDCATDTSFVISGDIMPDSVTRCDFAVTPFNGPDPRTDRTNWTGNLLNGVVFSAGSFDYTSIVISSPLPSPASVSLSNPREWLNLRSEEMVANVYAKYGK